MDTPIISNAPQKVVPLLAQLGRAEDLVGSIAMRLDPITQHVPEKAESTVPVSQTVTARLQGLGDRLQYLLDNIEL